MSDVLTLAVAFHSPFRVGTGNAHHGADSSIDRAVPVPGSSLKGAMRAAARDLLGGAGPYQHGGDHPLVVDVFGDEEDHGRGQSGGVKVLDDGSPWHWEDVVVDVAERREPVVRNRVRVDPETRTVTSGALVVSEEFDPVAGTVEIWRSGWVAAEQLQAHMALLAVSARLIDGLGADRRAGLGWVSLTPIGVTAEDWRQYATILARQAVT